MKTAQWLDRDIHILSMHYALCLSEEAFKTELDRLGIKEPQEFTATRYGAACVHTFDSEDCTKLTDKRVVCLVTLRVDPTKTLEQVHALLIHEAVHLWQRHCRIIGEDNPSDEMEAYAIQNIAQCLITSYRDQMKAIAKKPAKPPPGRRSGRRKAA